MIIVVEEENMKALCDCCETAPATVFCPADEAALCSSCDDMVHTCNKLASRHLRVSLANPKPPLLCDVCENSAAFFFCEVDGLSLCLQCDMIVHVGGKRTHIRFIILRQRIEFPDEPFRFQIPAPRHAKHTDSESQKVKRLPLTLTLGDYTTQAPMISPAPVTESSRMANKRFDLNMTPGAVP